jgi:hypothetical protein
MAIHFKIVNAAEEGKVQYGTVRYGTVRYGTVLQNSIILFPGLFAVMPSQLRP